MTPSSSSPSLFFDSDVCKLRQGCVTCRSLRSGRRWRHLISRVHIVPKLDFDCPNGLPWTEATPVRPAVAQPPTKAQWLLGNVEKIRTTVPSENPIVAEVIRARDVINTPGGCGGCKRRRVLRDLDRKYASLTEEQKKQLESSM